MSKILVEFKNRVFNLFDSEEEWLTFLKTESSAFGGKSPEAFILKSRRADRLEFAIETVKSLKNTYMFVE